MSTPSNASRHRGALNLPARPRFDGPVARELRVGLARVGSEVRRMVARVAALRALRAVDREERRASRELAWLRNELEQAEHNWNWLQIEYRQRRDALNTRVNSVAGDPQ